jgi:hypothetical protein
VKGLSEPAARAELPVNTFSPSESLMPEKLEEMSSYATALPVV